MTTAATLVGGSMMLTSCGFGTAGQAIASQLLTNYATTGSALGGGNLAATAIQTILKDKNMANTLGTIAQNMMQGYMQKGTSFSYSGASDVEALAGTYEPMAYNTIGKGTPSLNVTLTTNKATVAESKTAALTIPAFTVAKGITTSEMTIANMGITTRGGVSTIALTDNSGFSGTPTLTVNGTDFAAATVYVSEAKVEGNTLSLNMTLYYGKDYTNPVNLVYSGTVKL